MADALYQCLKTDQADAVLYQFLERQIEELEQSNDLGIIPLLFLIRLSKALGVEPIITDEEAHFFVPVDGEFRANHGYGVQAESGSHVDLLLTLYREQNILNIQRVDRKKALSLMLNYFEIHIPSFNVNRSLEVLKEVLD
jgi:DNA repair protein RecO (recombination protein O)